MSYLGGGVLVPTASDSGSGGPHDTVRAVGTVDMDIGRGGEKVQSVKNA